MGKTPAQRSRDKARDRNRTQPPSKHSEQKKLPENTEHERSHAANVSTLVRSFDNETLVGGVTAQSMGGIEIGEGCRWHRGLIGG